MHDWRADVRARVAPLRLDRTTETQLIEELSAHLADRYRDLVARGVPHDEAVRRASAELESQDLSRREWCRVGLDVRAAARRERRMPATLLTDMRQAWRSVVRRPAHAAAVVCTLGLGMAATTTLYAVVDAVIIRPLPYSHADRLVVAGLTPTGAETAAGRRQTLYGASAADAIDWRDRAQAFEILAPVEERTIFHDWGQGPELIDTAVAGEGFLELFDAVVLEGRPFGPADFAAGAPEVALVSHATWINHLGAARDVVGRQVAGLTIVGVMAPGFVVPEAVLSRPPAFWRPLRPADVRYEDRRRRTSLAAGRLRPGVSLEAARRDLDAAHSAVALEHPVAHRRPDGGRTGVGVNHMQAETVGDAGRPVLVFFGAAALLLALATVNACNLVLLRTLDRRGELSLRRALGADGGRLMRGLLAENVLVALAACAVGAGAAYGGVELFVWFGPESMPRLGEIAVNGRVLAVSALASVGVGLLVGLVPGLRAVASTGITPAIKPDTGYTAASGGGQVRMVLVGVQVALAAVLIVAAGLLVSSYVRLGTTDLGFEPDGLTTFTLPIKIRDDQSSEAVWNAVLAEVGRVPGLSHVAGTSDIPFTVSTWKPGVGVAGAEPGPILGGYAGFIVTPSYFSTIGAHIVDGRDFAASDGATAEGAVVVNETFARRFVEGRPAVGVPISVFGGFGQLEGRIVGVVADIVEGRVQTPIRPAVYLLHTQMAWMIGPTVVVRSGRPAATLLPDLRRAAAAYDTGLPVIGLGLMRDRANHAIVDPRFRAALFAAFAIVSLCLAALGLYGSLAHAVGRRRKELGIRMALGADARRVSRMVLRQGALVGGLGLAVGLASALALSRVLESFLFGVTSREPVIFIGTAAVLLGVSLLAALTPARRAASGDLVASLRQEN